MKSTVKLTFLLFLFVLGSAATFRSDNGRYFEITKNIEIYTNLYKELNTYYVDDIDPGRLMKTGINAMVGSLDPYTNYISENDIESYRLATEGKYNGIGAISKKIDDYVTIIEIYKDQSANKAGLKAGDQIIRVDGKDTKGKTPAELNEVLRGAPSSKVDLTIKRPGTDKPFDVEVLRSSVEVPNVPFYDIIDGDIGYVTLTTFTRNAGKNVAKAVRELKERNPNLKGVVFDLRGNGGGLLSEAVNVSNVFIPKGELVASTRGKVKEWDRSFKTLNSSIDEDIPLVVVINDRSASASEIVCGVMQDYDRGVLVGQRSYGKGLVQNTKDVGYNARVKLTTAKYYIPSGRCIQSVEYDDGEPVDLPEDQRTPFKTRNGRTVFDGGGVKPDITTPKLTESDLVKALIEQDYIFKYVTEFTLENDSIASIDEFEFTGFGDFVDFLERENFQFETESEKLIKKLEAKAEEEGYSIQRSLLEVKSDLQKNKKEQLTDYKEALIKLIEKEIISRYYYAEGEIKMGLRKDQEIKEAIAVLNDTTKYNALLKGMNK